jgi:hypothetical protein
MEAGWIIKKKIVKKRARKTILLPLRALRA